MTYDERAKKLRLVALGMARQGRTLSSQQTIQNKQQLSLQFKVGVARLVLSVDGQY